MDLSEISLLAAALLLLYIGLKKKYEDRLIQNDRDRLLKEQTETMEEITRLSNKVRDEITQKKGEYEEAKKKLVVLAVHDGDKPDGDSK